MINPDRLTVKSAEALNDAIAIARRNGNPLVYDLHLLHALLAQDEGIVVPVLQKAQYLGMSADKALLEVEGVDSQKIPVGVRGVAIFKVGDDERSITNAATRFLDAQQGQMLLLHRFLGR